jgi:two-component system chemotaxis response regulator CheY
MKTYSDSVLIADDNHVSLDLLKGILASLGYHAIQRFKDGKSALTSYQNEKSDILFLDINMPLMSGLEVLKEVRALDPQAFVVIVSGESSADNIKECLMHGAQGFVVKPYSASRIKDVLDKYQKAKPGGAG